MSSFFDYNNKFIQIMNKVADMMITSTMWSQGSARPQFMA